MSNIFDTATTENTAIIGNSDASAVATAAAASGTLAVASDTSTAYIISLLVSRIHEAALDNAVNVPAMAVQDQNQNNLCTVAALALILDAHSFNTSYNLSSILGSSTFMKTSELLDITWDRTVK